MEPYNRRLFHLAVVTFCCLAWCAVIVACNAIYPTAG